MQGRRRDVLIASIGAIGTVLGAWVGAKFAQRDESTGSRLPDAGPPGPKPSLLLEVDGGDMKQAASLAGYWKGQFVEDEVDGQPSGKTFDVDGMMTLEDGRLSGEMKFTGKLYEKVHLERLSVRLRYVQRPAILLSFVNKDPQRAHVGACVGNVDGMGTKVEGHYLSYGLDHRSSIARGTFQLTHEV